MLKPSAVSKDNDQSTSEKKNKKRNVKNKNKKGTNAEAPKNIGTMDKSNNAAKKTNGRRDEKYTRLPVTQGYFGGEKNAWSGGTKSLFPNSSEAARNDELSEEEQMKLALEASLETAMLEQCVIDSAKDDGETVDDKSDSDDENIWDGVHQNLPPANSEESIKSFDANNNAGANKSQISSIETKKIEDKIASSDVSTVPKNEPTSESQKIVPLDVPITPPIVPKFIDCFGRMDGYSEKHPYMGKGGRMKEENLRRQVQQHRPSNGSQQNQYYGSGPQNSYPPRSAPAPMHDNYGAAKGSNDRRGREPPFPFPRDAQRPKYPQVVEDNSRNDNYGRVKQWNDSNRHGLPSQDSHRPKNSNVVEDNSRNDNHGRAKQWNDTNRQSLPSQDSHRPKYSQFTDENSHNDRSQRRPVANAPPNHRSYDASKNPYKFQRDPNSRNAANSDKEDSQKSDENHHDDDYRSDTVANREVKIPSLMTTKIDNPSCVVTIAQESVRSVDRSEVKTIEETPEKIESEIRKEIEEFSENPKSHIRLSDFSSRLNTPHEQVSLPIDRISSCTSASSFINAPLPGYDSCQKNEMQIHPPMFSVPPPGFESLESVRHSCGNAGYVVPIESSISTSPFPMIPQNAIESPNVNTPEIGDTLPIPKADLYARIKITDPMLYELLMQKEELDGVRKNPPMIPEVHKDLPIPQNSSQDSHNLYDLPTGQQQQQQQLRRQNELLNPNAKQFSPNSEQSWIALNQPEPISCFSRVANYDPPSMPYQHQYAGLSQDIQRQDNSMWNHPTTSHIFHNTEQSTQQQHVHANVSDATPTAILGRHNHMVSEKNFPYRNAPGAMNIPQLNDDYPRCPPSGYENIPMVTQRQVPYRPSLPQCGIAPNHFCSAPCAASYGSQNQAATSKCVGCSYPANFHQQYAEYIAMCRNSMNPGNIDVRRVNDDQHLPISSQDCHNSETNSIMQSEIPYVAPTIRQGVLNDNKPNVGRGRARNLNNKK